MLTQKLALLKTKFKFAALALAFHTACAPAFAGEASEITGALAPRSSKTISKQAASIYNSRSTPSVISAATKAELAKFDPTKPPVQNPSGSRPGWVVRQHGYNWGSAVWYITDQQIKMSGSFLAMIVDRKTNLITIYSVKSNRYKRYTLKDCSERLGTYRAKKVYLFGPTKVVGKTKLLNMDGTILTRVGKKTTAVRNAPDVEFRDDIIVSDLIKFSPEISHALEAVIYSVYDYGLPLKHTRSGYIKGKERRTTQSVVVSEVYFAKHRLIPDSSFSLPPGIKITESEVDLISADSD